MKCGGESRRNNVGSTRFEALSGMDKSTGRPRRHENDKKNERRSEASIGSAGLRHGGRSTGERRPPEYPASEGAAS